MCEGELEKNDDITTLPGYHVLSALLATLVGDCSPRTLRAFNAGAGLWVALVAFAIARALGSRYPSARACSLYFLPPLFPYHFVAYTDVTALLAALFALWFLARGRWRTAGAVGSCSVLLRQSNVIVLLFMLAVLCWQRDRSLPLPLQLRRGLRQGWTCLLGLGAFALFVVIHGGVALGDSASHALGLHLGNVYFALALLAAVYLPLGLVRLWRARTVWWSRTGLAAVSGVYLLFLLTWQVRHPYNMQLAFLRNRFLAWADGGFSNESVFFLAVVLGLGMAVFTPCLRRAYVCWLPLSLLFLVPEGLIEQRYSVLPLAFFLLARRDGPPLAEALTVVGNAAVSVALLLGVARDGLML
jgi:alpha-1,2-glucosyltransferase